MAAITAHLDALDAIESTARRLTSPDTAVLVPAAGGTGLLRADPMEGLQ